MLSETMLGKINKLSANALLQKLIRKIEFRIQALRGIWGKMKKLLDCLIPWFILLVLEGRKVLL